MPQPGIPKLYCDLVASYGPVNGHFPSVHSNLLQLERGIILVNSGLHWEVHWIDEIHGWRSSKWPANMVSVSRRGAFAFVQVNDNILLVLKVCGWGFL